MGSNRLSQPLTSLPNPGYSMGALPHTSREKPNLRIHANTFLEFEQWIISIAAVFAVGFFAVAIYQPDVFDPEPDWEVWDLTLGGPGSRRCGYFRALPPES